MAYYLRLIAAALLLASCTFPALGLSGSAIEYSFNGSHFSAISPMCVINPGGEQVTAVLGTNDGCIRAAFADGKNETELPAGGQACIALEPLCGDVTAQSVKITASSKGGLVSTAVARSAKITRIQPAPGPISNETNFTEANAATPPNPGFGETAGVAGQEPGYELVLILAMVIILVPAWYLTKYYFHH